MVGLNYGGLYNDVVTYSGAGPPGRQATRRGGAVAITIISSLTAINYGLCSSVGLPSRRSGATSIRRHYYAGWQGVDSLFGCFHYFCRDYLDVIQRAVIGIGLGFLYLCEYVKAGYNFAEYGVLVVKMG